MNQKARYFLSCLVKQLRRQGMECPSCGHAASSVADRKFAVATLRRCARCRLLFRAPTTTAAESAAFYQEAYSQGYTTDAPDDRQLAEYLDKKFAGTERDYTRFIDVVRRVAGRSDARLFEFGCSWGYGSWQFKQSGFEVEAFEVSAPRAEYARRKLGVKVHSALSEAAGGFDVVFSSHVLEHVPAVEAAITFAFSILKPGGHFIAFTPNGSAAFRAKAPELWHKAWGFVHPNFLDEEFYRARFAGRPHFLAANPYPLHEIERWSATKEGGRVVEPLSGDELMIVARRDAGEDAAQMAAGA